MESGQHDESSKESDKPDSGGRFYECTFCKQGFTTAQALGGHMNIHRRERARIRHPALPSASITIQPTEEQRRPGISRPISSSYPQAQDTPINYHMYLPSSPSTSTRQPHPFTTDGSRIQRPRSLILFEEDQSTNLSLGIGYAANEEGKKQEDEVDLELRLGHDP